MKILFFDKVVYEGTPEECKNYKKALLKKSEALHKAFRETPIEKDTQVTFETLESINPTAYEILCYFKELIGEPFIEYQFIRMSLPGVVAWVRDDSSPNQRRGHILGHIFLNILTDDKRQTVWCIEE